MRLCIVMAMVNVYTYGYEIVHMRTSLSKLYPGFISLQSSASCVDSEPINIEHQHQHFDKMPITMVYGDSFSGEHQRRGLQTRRYSRARSTPDHLFISVGDSAICLTEVVR